MPTSFKADIDDSDQPNAPGHALVCMERVDKVFDNGTEALQGLDLTVRQHEFLSLLGPSGCGKSTALRLIAGLATASSGHIRWSKRDKSANRRPAVGFVFQEPTLMPWATVFDNVFSAASPRRPGETIGDLSR